MKDTDHQGQLTKTASSESAYHERLNQLLGYLLQLKLDLRSETGLLNHENISDILHLVYEEVRPKLTAGKKAEVDGLTSELLALGEAVTFSNNLIRWDGRKLTRKKQLNLIIERSLRDEMEALGLFPKKTLTMRTS